MGDKWDKVFKNGPSEICGRQPLKQFTWSILEYFVPNVKNYAASTFRLTSLITQDFKC